MTSTHVSPPFHGVFPVAPTQFSESGEVDFQSQGRVLDCMVDQGADGVYILANFSEQFSLTDSERDSLVDFCLEHVAGRLPVIVTCSHFNFENRQCGLRAVKAVMVVGGVIRSDATRHPIAPLPPATRTALLELAREVDPVVLRWGR